MKNKIKENSRISTRHKPYVISKASTSGITLIALIVTIVVLIILAAISINTAIGDSGIIKMAEKAKDEAEKAAQQEANELEELSKILGADAVARTKEKYYTSLQLAVDDVKENTKTDIFLLKDIRENVKVPNNKDIELYMNGHTQSNISEDEPTISVER